MGGSAASDAGTQVTWEASDYDEASAAAGPAVAIPPQPIITPVTPHITRTVDVLKQGDSSSRKRTGTDADLETESPVTPKRPAHNQQLPTPAKTGHRTHHSGVGSESPSKTHTKPLENKEAAALLALIATLQPQLSETLTNALTRFTDKQSRLLNAAHQQQGSLRNIIAQQQATVALLQTRCQLAKSEAEVFRSSAAAMRVEMANMKHARRCERAAALAVAKSSESLPTGL
ncbi:hypothetical protein BCR37DRAFT_20929 [Protomyces lactucae-debilis]|uniref:Uncharacterized protein n=1 Tax=Protomyces lactucae-debilis TaxID=2754530 RepID=A0A1Y2FD94_PROLT|nr:uncharacterized protein BCR37DRAFT_20929 [Protomyces lactucae-debilis]ORY81889.1 hypothetical protein BCR37DRAFT_20929 [Protomyces lactucae-debilis]